MGRALLLCAVKSPVHSAILHWLKVSASHELTQTLGTSKNDFPGHPGVTQQIADQAAGHQAASAAVGGGAADLGAVPPAVGAGPWAAA